MTNLAYTAPPCLRLAGHIFNANGTHCVVCGWVPKGLPHPDAQPAKERAGSRPRGFNGSHARQAATRRLIIRDGSWCYYCTIILEEQTTTIDHVVALANDGPHEDANFKLSCRPCNHSKGNSSEDDFRASEFLLQRQKMVAKVRLRMMHEDGELNV